MSIVEQALQKTKGMHDPRQRPGSPLDRAPAPRTTAGHADPARRNTVKFPLLPFDAEICAENRILVPTATHNASNAHATSAFRMLRTRVLHRVRRGGLTTLGITSPGPGEGKTLVSLNLALTIAMERNSDVFLLDLDMRKPGLCSAIGVHPQRELLQYFSGDIPAHDAFFSIGVENLSIASGLTAADHSSELLANGRLAELLTYIKSLSSSALILVDLPPILDADDALVAAPLLDTLLLVAAEGRTRRDGLKRSLDVLSEFKLAGIILNRSHDRLSSGYYQY